jgi:hypothetical protein
LTKQPTERQTFQKSNLSVFTILLGSVGHVEEVNRSDLDSHANFCVCGKEVLVFNDFDMEVTVSGWDPEGETQSLRVLYQQQWAIKFQNQAKRCS